DLAALAARSTPEAADRFGHHLIWPERPYGTARSILVAGCGTSQAARHALRHPDAEVVGIDVSATSIEHTARLVERHGIGNLRLRRLAIEDVGQLDRRFDHVVCTGVVHHLADPEVGLRALRGVLADRAAITLMVYGRHGRIGVYLLQEYCRRLGITTDQADIDDLVATLRELPTGHPLSRLLRETRDFGDDDALADALLNPRDRAYSVPELLELVERSGLRFGRWARQATYLPDCGTISETPHAARIARLPPFDQYTAVELFRGTIDRHTAILFDADDSRSGRLDFSQPSQLVPIVAPTAVVVDDASRLPGGAAAALLNRAHSASDLVLFVDRAELDVFRALDGRTTVAELGGPAERLVERLWKHDLVAIDATSGGSA
ncbi:MAG TPA: class I SAM-dependent methyltransferase, partial [Ilumatobacter sp.]|nr:class I SAM-dependent methyltransferase [Ilumatobacter sp.]